MLINFSFTFFIFLKYSFFVSLLKCCYKNMGLLLFYLFHFTLFFCNLIFNNFSPTLFFKSYFGLILSQHYPSRLLSTSLSLIVSLSFILLFFSLCCIFLSHICVTLHCMIIILFSSFLLYI